MNLVVEGLSLSGAEILNRLRQGHMVRRACWMDDLYIRITNESGYDAQGYAIFDDRESNIYTIATDGYFMHLAHSNQPYRTVEVFNYSLHGWEKKGRQGEGIQMLWADDWEDYGWISRGDFNKLTAELKDALKVRSAQSLEEAIQKAKEEEANA